MEKKEAAKRGAEDGIVMLGHCSTAGRCATDEQLEVEASRPFRWWARQRDDEGK